MRLWYRQPAGHWLQALPIGNGRLGAMIFGRINPESIQLNEDSVWERGPEDRNNPDAHKYLDEIRELIFKGEIEQAEYLATISQLGMPNRAAAYQPLGELILQFESFSQVTDYVRELDIATGIAKVSYRAHGVRYQRELFSSCPDQVLVVRLTADEPGKLSFGATMRRRYDARTTNTARDTQLFWGQCGSNGSRFAAAFRVLAEGGDVRSIGDHIVVSHADAVTIILAAATDFRFPEYQSEAARLVDQAATSSYVGLRRRHVEDHRALFERVSLSISADPATEDELRALPTDERIRRVKEGGTDLGLVAQYFQFGRYLLMGSSRPGSMPANLQGLWNESLTPPWDSKYTININTQMNYWPAEVCHLSECHLPLFDLLDRLRVTGRKTAEIHYGCRGFVAHHNTDLWADSAPIDFVWSGLWPTGAAWLALHLWDRYDFTRDEAFLRDRALPVMLDASRFLLDFMIQRDGQLLFGPSISPENSYRHNGQTGTLCMSPAMDTQIITSLFTRSLQAMEILDVNEPIEDEMRAALMQLPPMKIGRYGQLQEWTEDYEETDPGHRHISHLFAVYPDEQITESKSPELFRAARRALERRLAHGGGGTGWSRAWVIALWARFGEGALVEEHLTELLKHSTEENLLDTHPIHASSTFNVFQIDGNFGATAAIAEALLQSHEGAIRLLPALPGAWKNGSVQGLRARGNFEVSIEWRDGELTAARITSHAGGLCRLRIDQEVVVKIDESDGQAIQPVDGFVIFPTKAGETYAIRHATEGSR